VTLFLAFLLMSVVLPTFLISNANADDDENLDVASEPYGNWHKIQTDLITILFPAGGKKPMFLWWYTNDTSNIYVIKYKGLIEYLTLDVPYYLQKCEANALRMRERLEAKFAMPGHHNQMYIKNRIFDFMTGQLSLHPSYLPFSACGWNLTGPTNVIRDDGVSYISFNFTLVDAPKRFGFAEGNVVIRCRFYATDAVEDVYGLYNYTVKAGELKMDFVVNGWEWNIDKLDALFNVLHDEFNITVPNMKAGLALWINLASIKIEDMPIAENDSNTSLQTLPEDSEDDLPEPLEANSATSDMIVGGQRIRVRGNMPTEADPLTGGTRLRERLKLHFAKESQELAGFFDFVNTATVINSTTGDKSMVNVTAAYMAGENHMRLYLGYPYFGNNTLEHDPTIGVETVASWLPTNLVAILIAATIAIAVAVVAVKMRKRTVNIVSVQ